MATSYPGIRVIILSMHTEQEYIFNFPCSGAKGYLHKSISCEELIDAIEQVYQRNEYLSKEVSSIILKSYLKQIKEPGRADEYEGKKLIAREPEILRMVAQGYSNQLNRRKVVYQRSHY